MRSTQKHLQRITIENPTDRSNIAQNTNNTNYRRSTPLHQRAQDHANRATPQHYSHKYSNKHTNNSGSTTPLQIQLKTLQTKTNLKIRALRKAEETNKQQSSDITKLQADLVEVEVKIARILRQKQKQDASNLSLNTQELQTLREQEHDLAALKTQHEQLEQAYNEQLAIGNQNRREIASFGQKLKFKKNQNSRIIFLVKALEDRRAHDLQLGNLRGQILRMLERFDQERVLSEPEIETLVLKQEEIKLVALEGLKRVMQFVEFKKLRWAFDAILGRNLISFEKSVRFKEAFVLLAAFERARKMSFFTKFILDQEGQDGVVGEVKRTSGYLLWRDLYQKRKLVYRNRVEGLKMVKKVISRKNFSQKIQFFTKLGNWLDFGRQAKLEMSNLLQRIKLKRSEGFLKLIQRRDLVETKIGLTERLISGTRERNLRLCFLRLKLWVGIDLENDLIAKSRSFELLRSNRLKTIKNQIDGFLGRSQAQEELRNQLRGVFSELKKFSQNRKIEGLEESIKGQKEEILGLDKVRFKADYRIEGYYFGFASQLKFLFLKKKGFWLLGLQIRSLGRGIGLRVAFSKLRAGRVVFGKVRNSFGKLMILGKEGRMRDVEELEVGLLGEISNQEQLIDHLEADNVVLEKNLKNSKIAKLCRNLMYYVKDIAFEVFIERTELVRRKRGLILTIFQKIEFSVKERFRANLSRLRHQTDLLALLETRKRGSRQRIRLFILQKKFEKMKKFIQTKRQKTAFLSTISSNHYKKLRFSAFHTFKSEVQKIQNNQFSAQISSQSARSADLTLATQAKSIKLITLQKTEKSQKSKFQDFLLKKLFNRLITAQFCKLSASYTHLTSFCSRMGLFKLFLQTVKKVKKSRLQRPFLTLKAHALCKKEVQMSQNLKKMRIKKDELLEDQNQLAEQIEAFGAQRRFFDSYTAFEIKKLSQIQSKITKKGAEAPIQEKYLRGLLSRFLGVWKARLLQKRAMRRIMKLRDRPVDLKEALIIWKSRVRKDKLNALIMHKIGSVLHAGQVRHRKWGFGVLKHFELISEFENTKKRILGYTRLERRDRALMEGERFLNVELILARLTFSKKSENMKFLFEVLGNEGFEKRMVGGAQAVFMRRRRERVWKAFFGVLKDMRFLTKRVDFIRSKRAMGRKVYLLRLLQFNLWARRAEKLKLANFLKSAESPFFRAKTEIWGHLRAKVDLCYASEPKLRSTVSIFSRKVENLIFENRVKNLSKGLRTIATYKRKEYRALLSCLNRIFSRKAKMVVRSLQRYSEYKRHIINDSKNMKLIQLLTKLQWKGDNQTSNTPQSSLELEGIKNILQKALKYNFVNKTCLRSKIFNILKKEARKGNAAKKLLKIEQRFAEKFKNGKYCLNIWYRVYSDSKVEKRFPGKPELARGLRKLRAELFSRKKKLAELHKNKLKEDSLSLKVKNYKNRILRAHLKHLVNKIGQNQKRRFLRKWYKTSFLVDHSLKYNTRVIAEALELYQNRLLHLYDEKEAIEEQASTLKHDYAQTELTKLELIRIMKEKEKLSVCLSDKLDQLEAVRKDNTRLRSQLRKCKEESQEIIGCGLSYLGAGEKDQKLATEEQIGAGNEEGRKGGLEGLAETNPFNITQKK